jgi:glycosyltransferase involved in cell wall biosynthesis
MKLTVLSVAYPMTEVGEDAVGGSEQILTLLDRALTDAGHNSLVIAVEGSRIAGTLIPSPPAKGKIDETARRFGRKIHKQLIRDALTRYPIDLVHMHSLDFHQYLPDQGIPTLATLHLPPDWYPRNVFQLKRDHFYLNCVSLSQQRTCPRAPSLLPPIGNGVDITRLDSDESKRNYVLALGRICPEKGFHLALDAAKIAGAEMLLAGELIPFAVHQEYFRKKIAPRLDTRRRFLGPVGFNRKRRLLSQAQCLLITSTVAETSSLVAMEAMAAGTPVIAFPVGALPEVIDNGRTGYLVADEKEMARAIGKVAKLDPEVCRQTARARFSARRMVEEYIHAYRQILAKKTLEEERMRARSAASWLVGW